MTKERREIPTRALVVAAVLGLLAGVTACGSTQSAAGVRPANPHAVPPTADKNACGNHPGSACAAIDTPAPSK